MNAPQTVKLATVVVIDDDEAMLHSLEWLIRSSGHDVQAFDSGLQYLDAAVGSGRPDCVVLDIHMPDISGLDLYGIIKTQNPDIPVIFITGLPDQIMAEKARTLESQRFFSKPLNTDALLNCIDKALTLNG